MSEQPRRRRRRRRYRGRLRPQFIIFCLVMALLLGGMIFLLVRCAAGDDEPADTPPVEDGQNTGDTVDPAAIPASYVPATADMGEGPLILVSNDQAYTFPEVNMVVSLEERTGDYLVRDYSIQQEEEAFRAFDRMLSDFAAATGLQDVNITSAFRSYEEQESVFNASAEANGLEHAKKYVTNPGHSEHHTGLAVDLNVYNVSDGTCYDFDGQGEYKWIYDHCKDYGIVLRYSLDKEYLTGISAESWHFRYVGVPHAAYMKENLLCLEEYIDLLRDYPVGKPLVYDGYTVYFCPKDALYVPQSGNYTVSGNNVDGYIVTVE